MLTDHGFKVHAKRASQKVAKQHFHNPRPSTLPYNLHHPKEAVTGERQIGEKHTEQKQQQVSQIFAQGGALPDVECSV